MTVYRLLMHKTGLIQIIIKSEMFKSQTNLIGIKRFFFLINATQYACDDEYIFEIGFDNILRRCVSREEAQIEKKHKV